MLQKCVVFFSYSDREDCQVLSRTYQLYQQPYKFDISPVQGDSFVCKVGFIDLKESLIWKLNQAPVVEVSI